MSVNSEWFRLKVIYFALVSVAGVKVCCPKSGTADDPLTSDNTNLYEYDCDDLSSVKNNEQNFNYSNSTTHITSKYGICANKSQVVLLIEGNYAEIIDGNRTCLVLSKTEYHAIECSKPSDSDQDLSKSTRIRRAKKCCHFDDFYNKTEKKCHHLPSDSPVSAAMEISYKNLFDKSVILETENSQFMCKSNQVLVVYFRTKKKVHFEDGRLIVDDKYKFPPEEFCFDVVSLNESEIVTTTIATEEEYVFQACHSENICEDIPCITRCCASSKDLEQNTTYECYRNVQVDFHQYDENDELLPVEPLIFGVRRGLDCVKHILPIDDIKTKRPFFDYKTGELRFANETITEELEDAYCVDYVKLGKNIEKRILECEAEYYIRFVDEFKPTGLCISVVFLALTLAVYLFIPKLRNLHGQILLFEVVNLMATFIIYLLMIFNVIRKPCKFWGHLMYFFFMSTFTWLNVLCFDIWRTFSSLNRSHCESKSDQNRKLLYYNLYAFGIAILLLAVLLIYSKCVRNALGIRCWFQDRSLEDIIFMEIPSGIFILLNIVFFIMTLVYYNRVKNQIRRMQNVDSPEKSFLSQNFRIDKDVLLMNVKLFFVMGISWLFEVFGSHLNQEAFIVIIADFINMLQGLLIFILFVCKRSIFIELRKELGLLILKFKRGGNSSANQSAITNFDMSTSTRS